MKKAIAETACLWVPLLIKMLQIIDKEHLPKKFAK